MGGGSNDGIGGDGFGGCRVCVCVCMYVMMAVEACGHAIVVVKTRAVVKDHKVAREKKVR